MKKKEMTKDELEIINLTQQIEADKNKMAEMDRDYYFIPKRDVMVLVNNLDPIAKVFFARDIKEILEKPKKQEGKNEKT